MNEVITSRQNNRIKSLRKLYNTRQRRKEKKYVLEGFTIVQEALNADCKLHWVFMTPDFFRSSPGQRILKIVGRKHIYIVDKKLFEEIADTYNPQGILAVVNESRNLDDKFLKESEYILLLDRIQDPGNMGTIIRTAAAAGFDAIIALKGSVDIYNLKVLRSTMGAIFEIPVFDNLSFNDFKEFYGKYQDEFTLIGADPKGERYYYEADLTGPVIISVGNEANGICSELLDICDFLLKIPLVGKTESLNAAIAAGIITYKAVEQRFQTKTKNN